MQIEEPEIVQNSDGRTRARRRTTSVTGCDGREIASLHELRSTKVSASKVCHKGYPVILNSEPGQSGMLHKHTNDRIVLREEKGVCWQKEIEGPQFDTV